MSEYLNPYAHGKFYEARNYLALGRGTLRNRICKTFLADLLMVREEDLPDGMQKDFAQLRAMVTERPPDSWRGSVEATLSDMHWKRVHKCAEMIVDLATKADQALDPKWNTRVAK